MVRTNRNRAHLSSLFCRPCTLSILRLPSLSPRLLRPRRRQRLFFLRLTRTHRRRGTQHVHTYVNIILLLYTCLVTFDLLAYNNYVTFDLLAYIITSLYEGIINASFNPLQYMNVHSPLRCDKCEFWNHFESVIFR